MIAACGCSRTHASPAPRDDGHRAAAVPAASDPGAAFWKWFTANDDRLFTFEKDRDGVFKDLTTELHRVDADLTFEFGPVESGRREFVVSAGGIRSAFPAVQKLVASAPSLPRWTVIAFRQRRPVLHDVTFENTTVRVADVHFRAEPDGGRIALKVFIRGYKKTDHRDYEQAAYLLLDEALGEYTVETRIGYVSIAGATPAEFSSAHPLTELAKTVDRWDGGA